MQDPFRKVRNLPCCARVVISSLVSEGEPSVGGNKALYSRDSLRLALPLQTLLAVPLIGLYLGGAAAVKLIEGTKAQGA